MVGTYPSEDGLPIVETFLHLCPGSVSKRQASRAQYIGTLASAPGGFGFATAIESLSATSTVIGSDADTRYGYFTDSEFGPSTG